MNVPMNLQDLKNSVLAFNNPTNGKLYEYVNDQYAAAKHLMQQHAKDSTKVVVLDLDETILDKSAFGASIDYGYTQENLVKGWTTVEMPCFQAAKDFMLYCMENKNMVYIITGREEQYRSDTINQLHFNEIEQGKYYWSLVMKPTGSQISTQEFKTQQRKALYDAGLTVAANIGDKDADLEGGYCENKIRLINVMY